MPIASKELGEGCISYEIAARNPPALNRSVFQSSDPNRGKPGELESFPQVARYASEEALF
jgi:hypothetical protein